MHDAGAREVGDVVREEGSTVILRLRTEDSCANYNVGKRWQAVDRLRKGQGFLLCVRKA